MERKFALEWLEDAFSMFQGVYLTIGEEIESITEAFYSSVSFLTSSSKISTKTILGGGGSGRGSNT